MKHSIGPRRTLGTGRVLGRPLNRRPRDTRVYELKEGNEIVYYGRTVSPDRRVIEHENAGKMFTHMNIITVALTHDSADRRETEYIRRYQRQHGGKPPKYNLQKTL